MKYYEDKSDRKMELKLLSLSEDDKLIRECMEQASAFYGCLGKMGVTEILCDRKKAQELGADCQITGIFTGGELTAFACAFEYTGLKRNGRKWLNPGDKEWRQIETLGTNVVVIPLLVGKEKVGRLIELLREQYRDSHLLFRISGEQSEKFQEDLAVVSEKNLKSHRYDAAGENVWLFHFAPQIRMEDTYFEEEILLILPGQEVLLEMGIEEAEVTMVKLTGYEIVRSEKGSAFFRKPGAACEGVLLQCDYEQLLRYQRFINLTNYEEHFEQTDRGKALIYSEKYQSDSSLLWNDLLREMVKTRKAEWSIVPDSYIMYPVTYKEQDRLLECACYDNQEIGNYMHYMDIRLQCETGVPFGKDGIDLMERYKNRLERIPLGRLRVRITLEMILDILDHEDQPVGCDAEAEAVLSIDRLSHIGVLTLVSLSTPFLLSHFLDNIVRNQLMVIGLGGTGSKIVCRVSQMVTEEQRKRIGFAVFDTDINELREIREANPFIKTIQTSTKLTVGEYLNIDTHARDEWFPVNGILNSKSLTEGAGQVRAISRLALDTAIRAGNMEPLHNAIEELYKLEGDSSEQALRVVIVSSLAGGTGSGLILPVALYLKNYLATKFQASANITRGFFILPEVFYEVIRGQSERNNLKCNAYATLRELDAFLMKGDETLPEKYEKTVKLEFPRVGSNDVEEYNVRPYDFCFLFDAQNTEGKKLNSFNQYLDHAANCIYSQSIGPMNKRSNSSEDNTIRELCAERGRNRYAGAGSAMLIYPYEDVREYIALNWTKECVSSQWLVFDRMYKEKCLANAEMRAQGLNRRDINASVDYIESINQMAKQKDPFALSIEKACTIYDEGGYKKVNDKWTEYVGQLKKFVKDSTMNGQMDLDAQKNLAMGMINEVEIGSKQAAEELQDAYREMEKYKDMVVKRSEDTARTIAYSIFKAKNDSITKEKLPHQMETYLRDEEGNFIHPNAVRYFLYQALELMKAEKVLVEKENDKKEKSFDGMYAIFDNTKTDDEIETVDQLTERKIDKKTQQEFKDKLRFYIGETDKYRTSSVLAEVLAEGIDYISSLCEAFQNFYTSFENRIEALDRRIAALSKKYGNTAGRTSRYVCATPNCFQRLLKEIW